ncbi:MAG: hypothetical protein HOP30_13255 [Cyclobacteriaceae bacterium]|nr:hypothetical protein [Cyclobacteriaceae bacterium]
MEKLLGLLFISIGLSCNSQDMIVFKVKYTPGTNYNQTINQATETTVKYAGAQEFLQDLKARKIDNPTITTANSKTKSIIKTGKLIDNKSFPVSIHFIETTSSDGKSPIPNGTIIYGACSLEKFPSLDSISGTLSDDIKKVLLQTMQKSFSQMDFPEQKVRVGETFSRQTPLTLPIAGINLEISITTTYKLINVKSNSAMFDISQVYTFKSTIKDYDVKVTGTGKGNLIYDIDYHFYKRYQIDTDMMLNMKLDKLDLGLNSKSRFVQSVTITKG